MQLVLASSSPYRRALLARLGLPFEVMAPQVDETPLAGEAPWDTALRLAQQKAEAVARHYPGALIIGSDQVAVLDGNVLGKPGNFENAKKQLMAAANRRVVFHTALVLLNAATGHLKRRVVPFGVKFRPLSESQIERYLAKEQPYDCAGSAKSEGLGIVLIERFEGEDPNALVGLPLIALVDMLAEEGVSLP
ncbi:MAG: Maf-like protein [Burkholderiales bacterium]|jgi:septum formation protein|nr:Maf-like protein [Burkholderiales bacterium]